MSIFFLIIHLIRIITFGRWYPLFLTLRRTFVFFWRLIIMFVCLTYIGVTNSCTIAMVFNIFNRFFRKCAGPIFGSFTIVRSIFREVVVYEFARFENLDHIFEIVVYSLQIYWELNHETFIYLDNFLAYWQLFCDAFLLTFWLIKAIIILKYIFVNVKVSLESLFLV